MAAITDRNLSISSRFQLALSKALKQRCEEFTIIINESSTRDLHTIFPLLLESIFGFNNSPGWGLKTLHKQAQALDFFSLRMFLAPNGPLMSMVYKLQSDNYLRYEFLVSCLPAPSRHAIQSGVIPVLYSNKVSYQTQGRPSNVISLNAFEYFMFHFAYFIVYPKNKHLSNWSNPSDCLYPSVLEDYLNYFLPADNKNVSSLGNNSISSPSHQSPLHSPYSSRQSPSVHTPHSGYSQRAHHLTHSPAFSGLLRGSSNIHSRTPVNQTTMATDATTHETWRSETFSLILAEFWLNQNSLDTRDRSLSQQVTENFMPSQDHVRVVRMLVKHLHFFANSLRSSPISSPYQQHIETPLEDLKRSVIPHIFQKKLYAFLRHGFDKWPLDASFRLMLESWLSFIQPWRYTEERKTLNVSGDNKEAKDKAVSDQWEEFIIDNLLFYTTLFIDFLPRAFRQDLSASKNAYMLFRVCKVYGQSGLSEMIEEAEGLLYEQTTLGVGRHIGNPMGRPPSAGGSYLSSPRPPSCAVLRLQLAELEGQGFMYKPLFSEELQVLIEQLLGKILHAQSTLKLLGKPDQGQSNGGGLLSFLGFSSLMDYNSHSAFGSYTNDIGYDDTNHPTDIKKVESHLQQSLTYLRNIFKVEAPKSSDSSVSWGPSSSSSTNQLQNDRPDMPDMVDGHLSPLGRYQLMNGLKKFEIVYHGDPDLQPIRSFENPALVRFLYRVSSHINKQFGDKIEEMCQRSDLVGQLSKEFFSPPAVSPWQPTHSTQKCSPKSEQEALAMKPRLSLRFMASYQNIGYVLAFFMMCYVYNISFVMGIFLLLIFALFYELLKVTFLSPASSKQKRH
uniref:Sphingomyelin phosphodiesterase 4-like n=1 Tax=Saccoglossus kowalevskii TaxID=10224 RepID=A0ABM0MM62_SACKO|nr:PREDICTED: sphingomyelin phosphodiesterase 4-like [Saccoglossus kowalevskii]